MFATVDFINFLLLSIHFTLIMSALGIFLRIILRRVSEPVRDMDNIEREEAMAKPEEENEPQQDKQERPNVEPELGEEYFPGK